YHMTEAERRELGIASLPGSLQEALKELSADEVIKSSLGKHIYEKFVEAKEKEWDSFRVQVHSWEVEEYLTRY
ncbi:MAG: type I glutamate--ammonia ligase, partial [Desulfocucumaceae bacterium]